MSENPFQYSRFEPSRLDFEGVKRIETDPAEDLEAMRKFYENTGRAQEFEKLMNQEPIPPLEEKFQKILARIDIEMLERTMKKIKTIFAPPFPHHVEPEDILSPDELKNLVDALAIAAYDEKFAPSGAVAIENKLGDNRILEPADIDLLEKSIETFKKFV